MVKIFSAPVVPASAPSPAPAEAAIDIAHLGRMTFGEKGLEREVLRLFERQAAMLLARMKDAPHTELAAFAHTLTGSARGIGAWQVAKAAEAVELVASGRGQPDLAAALVKLTAAINEASAAITELLRAGGTTRQSLAGK
jgi:HPt (histidine-containing phosphotransfer) domain-containing protein